MDLIDIYRTFHPKRTEYSFFSSAHGTFSRIDHILGHKSGLNRYQKTDYSLHILRSQCFETGAQSQGKVQKELKYLKLKTTLLKNAWINQEIKEELKQFMETNENEDTLVQNLWDMAKVVLRGKYIAFQTSLTKIEKS